MLSIIYILEFEKRVLRELHILSLKADDISETVNALLKTKADDLKKSSVCSAIPDIIQSFPVNENSLAQLEEWLMNSEQNKTILVRKFKMFLNNIERNSVKELINNKELINKLHIYLNIL